MSVDAPTLIVLWRQLVGELLDRTRTFPKTARFTFSSRIGGLGLDVLDRRVKA